MSTAFFSFSDQQLLVVLKMYKWCANVFDFEHFIMGLHLPKLVLCSWYSMHVLPTFWVPACLAHPQLPELFSGHSAKYHLSIISENISNFYLGIVVFLKLIHPLSKLRTSWRYIYTYIFIHIYTHTASTTLYKEF